jgi:hypothetical protein
MNRESDEKNFSNEAVASTQQVPSRQESRVFLAPMPGFQWNPLLTLPRNRACPCLSGKKFKVCCLGRLPKVVPEKLATEYREQMRKPDLVFLTPHNQEELKMRIDPLVFAERAKGLQPRMPEDAHHEPEVPA